MEVGCIQCAILGQLKDPGHPWMNRACARLPVFSSFIIIRRSCHLLKRREFHLWRTGVHSTSPRREVKCCSLNKYEQPSWSRHAHESKQWIAQSSMNLLKRAYDPSTFLKFWLIMYTIPLMFLPQPCVTSLLKLQLFFIILFSKYCKDKINSWLSYYQYHCESVVVCLISVPYCLCNSSDVTHYANEGIQKRLCTRITQQRDVMKMRRSEAD